MIKLSDEKKPYTVGGQRVTHGEYVKTKYEDLRVRVPKGKKEIVSAHAEARSESVNRFINRAIDEITSLSGTLTSQQRANERRRGSGLFQIPGYFFTPP